MGSTCGTFFHGSGHLLFGGTPVRFIVDQTSLRVANDLRRRGHECRTATELVHGHEDSRFRASDFRILLFLTNNRDFKLLTADAGLAKDCAAEGVSALLLPNPLPPPAEVIRLVETS